MKRTGFPWTVVAVLGDAVILLGFAAIGRLSHHRTMSSPVADVLSTALPFLFGWVVGAAASGAYAATAWTGRRRMLARTVGSWIIGGVIALAIRSTLERRIVPLSFAIVALTFNLVLLSAWRSVLVSVRLRAVNTHQA